VVPKTIEKAPAVRDVLNYQITLNLIVYTFLAFYTLGYDQVHWAYLTLRISAYIPQLLPVFMHHPPQSIDDPNVSLPLKFAGGFGIDSRRIGGIFTIYSIFSTLCQFLLFPPLARHLGILNCLRISFLIFPFVFFVTPFIGLLPSQTHKEIALILLLMVRGVGGTFAFPTSTILITNSASSLRVLGTLNGLATSVSAVGRTLGPAYAGSLFTFGLKKGYIIIPFWALSVIALIASVPTWYLEEGKGFGDDPDSEVNSVISASASVESSPEDLDLAAIESESEYGEPTNLLTHTNTHSSGAVVSDDDMDFSEPEASSRSHVRRKSVDSTGDVRSHSRGRRRPSRTGKAMRRRSSVPIGMGSGFRRLSSNLGSTGVGAPGTSWGGT